MTVKLGVMELPVTEDADRVRDYLNGTIADGGLWTALRRASDHDHTGGLLGTQISVAAIPDGSITVSKLDPSVLLPYALVDGSKPFTGQVTMQADAIVRDTLYFGEQGTALPPDSFWSRTGPKRMRTDSALAIGVNPLAWSDQWGAILQLQTMSSVGGSTSGGLFFRDNSYVSADGKNRSIQNALAVSMSLSGGQLYYYTAPGVPAGNEQVFAQRFVIDAAGKAFFYGSPGALPSGGSQVTVQRSGPTTDWQAFRLGGGPTRDAAMYRRPNDDTIRWGYSGDGVNFESTMYVTPLALGGRLLVGDQEAGGNPAQQQYVALSYNAKSGGGAYSPPVNIEMAAPNPNYVGIDYHNPNNYKWGMLAASGQTLQVGHDIGWGRPLQISFNAPTSIFFMGNGGGSLYINGGNASNSRIATGTGNLELQAQAGYITPSVDNTVNLGAPNPIRWISIYLVNAPVVGSSADLKEDIAPLDPVACAQAVLETDWVSYAYKPPAYVPPDMPLDKVYDPTDSNEVKAEKREAREADEAAARGAHLQMVAETAFARQQKGYVLQHETLKVHDLFGLPDRASRSDGADLAVVACALQDALRRIAALEGAAA